MSHELSLDALTTEDKLVLMERLWAELSVCPQDVPSPNWHGSILANRIVAVQEGRSKFVDWTEAKQRLRNRLS